MVLKQKEGNYTISATVDGQSVTYNGSASLGKELLMLKIFLLIMVKL